MILKRLIEILKSFDKDELKRFSRFIRSDYFNTNERITTLYKELKKFYPLFDSPKLSNEYLFRQIYGKKEFDDKTFRYLLSELMELTEKFIAFSIVEKDSLLMKRYVIEGLTERTFFSQAFRMLKASEDKLDTKFEVSGVYFTNKIEFLHLWHQLIFYSNKYESLANKNLDVIVERGDLLTFHNLVEITHLFFDINTVKVNFNIEPKDNLIYGFLKNFNFKGMIEYLDNLELNYPNKNKEGIINGLRIYLCFMITVLDKTDEIYFYKAKELVDKYGSYYNKEELQNLYVMLINNCNTKRKLIDNEKYIRNYFEIVKSALSKNLFTAYEGQYMDVFGFYRMFLTALYLNEYVWAEDFAAKYVKLLAPEYREDFKNYTQAELCFGNGKYDESLKYLSLVKFSFFRLKLNVRMLTFMIYYELDYVEEAFSLIDSFTHFLTGNKKLTSEMRENSNNFVLFAKDLLKYKVNPPGQKKIDELSFSIIKSSMVHNQNWLLDKIQELEK